jgi:hypothetical protein
MKAGYLKLHRITDPEDEIWDIQGEGGLGPEAETRNISSSMKYRKRRALSLYLYICNLQ